MEATEKELLRGLVDVPAAADYLRCGRTRIFGLIRSGDVDSVKIGKRRLITAASLDRLVDRLAAS